MTAPADSVKCEQLDAYVDGELEGEALDAFEVHLATCERCGTELPRLLAVTAALDGVRGGGLRLIEGGAPRVAVEPAPVRRKPWLWVAGGALAAAAGIAFWLTRPAPAPQVASLAGELAAHRSLEPRLSYPGADAYRARDVARGQDSHEHISFERLDALEKQHDWHGLAAAALLVGEPTRAAQWFARAGGTAEVDSDRAALELVDGSPQAIEHALEHADRALAAAPNSGAARWNRALALAALDLPLAAARDFDRVVALHEQGWADEAATRAAALRAEVGARRTRWQAAFAAGNKLVEDGTPVPAPLLAVPGYMTLMLYDAVRAAPSRERVEQLLPMAQALDAGYHGDHLAAFVRRVAASDFRVRKPLTEAYRALLRGELADAAKLRLLVDAQKTHNDDLVMGALVRMGAVGGNLEDYRKLVAASGDPWFALIAEHEAAKVEIAGSKTADAQRRLEDAIELGRRERVAYRALQAERELVALLLQLGNLSQANTVARTAYREAIASGEAVVEMNLLSQLAAINAERYARSLARAYFAELIERTGGATGIGPSPFDTAHDCATQRYGYDTLANISLQLHEPDRARSEIAAAPRCQTDASTQGTLATRIALVRTELYRRTHRDDDARAARTSLAELRALPSLSDGQRAIGMYLDGALQLPSRRDDGRRAIRDAITIAQRDSVERDVRVKVHAYGHTLLALDAARASEFGGMLDGVAEMLAVRRPATCAVAVVHDDREVAVAFVDSRGEMGGSYSADHGSGDLEPQLLIPAIVASRLRLCERVAVLAPAPVLGSPRILPPDIAWSYLRAHAEVAKPTSGQRLVIANPTLPADAGMPALAPYPDRTEAGTMVLRGADATPSRTLFAMRDASVIELHTHGIFANDVSESSYLMLAPDIDRRYTLTAGDVAAVKLTHAPLVILGACHGAASSRAPEGGQGLPDAFLHAGARAVIASPEAVRDLEARAFFDAVRARVRDGADPATAVRDERLHRNPQRGDDSWISSVVVFD